MSFSCPAPTLIDDGRGLPAIPASPSAQARADLAGGFCHLLALELHERHGWALRGLGAPADEYSLGPWRGLRHMPRHIYCLNEHGQPVDVNGIYADEAAIRAFYAHPHRHHEPLISVALDVVDFAEELAELGYRPGSQTERAIASTYADKLRLHELGA